MIGVCRAIGTVPSCRPHVLGHDLCQRCRVGAAVAHTVAPTCEMTVEMTRCDESGERYSWRAIYALMIRAAEFKTLLEG